MIKIKYKFIFFITNIFLIHNLSSFILKNELFETIYYNINLSIKNDKTEIIQGSLESLDQKDIPLQKYFKKNSKSSVILTIKTKEEKKEYNDKKILKSNNLIKIVPKSSFDIEPE